MIAVEHHGAATLMAAEVRAVTIASRAAANFDLHCDADGFTFYCTGSSWRAILPTSSERVRFEHPANDRACTFKIRVTRTDTRMRAQCAGR